MHGEAGKRFAAVVALMVGQEAVPDVSGRMVMN